MMMVISAAHMMTCLVMALPFTSFSASVAFLLFFFVMFLKFLEQSKYKTNLRYAILSEE